MIETRDLRVRYPGGARAALDGVSVRIEAGTLFAVLGPNGSGKSTLTRAILGAAPVESGQILLDGRAASAWKRRELARVFAAVPQSEAMPFPMTAREMVGMGRYAHLGPLQPEGPEDRRVIDAALARCDVSDLADRLVQTLSGGELQRVRIARALAQEPRVLILDEPTASLDVRHEMAILELLAAAVRDGLTVLLVTHHLDLAARYADRLLILDEGKVVAVGPPTEVLTPQTLRAVYEWPLEVEVDRITGSPRVVPLSPGESDSG